jgi:hypothetical protein
MKIEVRCDRKRAIVSSVVSQRDTRSRFEVYVGKNHHSSGSYARLSMALRKACGLIGCDPSLDELDAAGGQSAGR